MSFNGTGKVTTQVGTLFHDGYSVAIQPDGRIVVAGDVWNGSNTAIGVVRYQGRECLTPTNTATPTFTPTPLLVISGAVTYGNASGLATPRVVSDVLISERGWFAAGCCVE